MRRLQVLGLGPVTTDIPITKVIAMMTMMLGLDAALAWVVKSKPAVKMTATWVKIEKTDWCFMERPQDARVAYGIQGVSSP